LFHEALVDDLWFGYNIGSLQIIRFLIISRFGDSVMSRFSNNKKIQYPDKMNTGTTTIKTLIV